MGTIESTSVPRVACFATQGSGSQDEDRIRALVAPLAPTVIAFDREKRGFGAVDLWRRIRAAEPDIVVMEGTGMTGGLAVMALRFTDGTPFVVSSGDAIAPFLAGISRMAGIFGAIYERVLYRMSSGFIGWSPYLVGRALTLGAQRGMTAANWAPATDNADGARIRAALGIPPGAIVYGIVGSLNWSSRYDYCYGRELIDAVRSVARDDVYVLVVGDGDGRPHLEALAGDRLGATVLLPGRVPRAELDDYLAAIDVASLPQSVDGVGSFRYTTKISEYLAAGLPIATGEIPLAYDLDDGSMFRLAGDAPWDPRYVAALARMMRDTTRQDLEHRRPTAAHRFLFDAARQHDLASAFVVDVLARNAG